MSAVVDITGQRFGRLVVIERAGSKNGKAYWLCKCDCGKTVTVNGQTLRSGGVKSCGCLRKENSPSYRDGTNAVIKATSVNNGSGVRGVFLTKNPNLRYEAYLAFKGKVVLRKCFATLEEAALARKEAEEKYFKPLIEQWAQDKAQKEASD